MASIVRFRTRLTGFQGAPGINTFHALDVGQAAPDQAGIDEFATQLQSMYDDLKAYQVTSQTITMLPEVDVFDIADGTLQERMTLTTTWSITGSDSISNTSKATHAKFRYRTDAIVNNRVLQGGIFFGPLSDAGMTATGDINTTFVNLVTSAHDGLLDVLGPLRLAVWAQPAKDASDGQHGYVQSVSVMPVPAVLRSRRD